MARGPYSTSIYLASTSLGQAWPYMASMWLKMGNETNYGVAFAHAAASGGALERMLVHPDEFITFQSVGPSATDTMTYTAAAATIGAWVHMAVFADQSAREFWVDGVSIDSGVVDVGAWTSAHTSIGINYYNSGSVIYPITAGRISDVAVWSVSTRFTDTEVAALAAGASPLAIRPASLRHYWRLNGIAGANEVSVIAGSVMTSVGTVNTAESHIASIGSVIVPDFVPAAGGSFQAAWARKATTTIGGGITA